MTKSSRAVFVDGPDGGWGWMIVISCAIIDGFAASLSQTMGPLFIELQRQFQSKAEETSWVLSITAGTTYCLGIIGSILGRRIGGRPTAFIGTLLVVSGLIISSFATSLTFLYITSGIIPGIGMAIALPPTLDMVGQYFPKRYIVAFSFATLGPGILSTFFPLLFQGCIEVYGWRGTYLVLAAISANMLVAAALLRPLSQRTNSMDDVDTLDSTRKCTPCHWCMHCCHTVCCDYSQFTIYLISLFLYGFAYNAYIVHFMSRAKLIQDGTSLQMMAFLLSVVGISSMIAKPLTGLAVQRYFTYPITCSILSQLLMGTLCFGLTPIHSYVGLCVVSILAGILIGIFMSLFITCGRIFVELDRFHIAVSSMIFTYGLGVLFGPPFAGFIYDVTGDYNKTYYMVGSVFITSGLIRIPGEVKRLCKQKSANNSDTEPHNQESTEGFMVNKIDLQSTGVQVDGTDWVDSLQDMNFILDSPSASLDKSANL